METAFDLQHILFIVFSLAAMGVALFLIKRYCKTEKSLRIAVYVCAALVFATFIWNRISIAAIGITDERIPNARNLLPNAYCGLAGLTLLPFLLIWRKDWNHPIFHGTVFIAFLGGIVTLIFPSTTVGNGDTIIFATRTLSNLTYHALAMFAAILLMTINKFKPNWRLWWAVLLTMSVHVAAGALMLEYFDIPDAMFINRPFVPGTFLTWPVVGALSLLIYVVMGLIFEYSPKLVAKFSSKHKRQDAVDNQGNA